MIDAVILTVGPLLTLEEVKLHLRVDEADEDSLIEGYADAAVTHCLRACDVKLVPRGAETVFKQAALLLIGQWYRNRMSVVVGTITSELPFGVAALLYPYKAIRI